MATDFKLPALGETVDSGTVVKLLVKEGDQIAQEQPVLELETGKAVVEVPSSVSGKITKVHAEEGATLKVGDIVLTVEGGANGAAPAPAAVEQKAEAKPAPEPTTAAKPAAPAPSANGAAAPQPEAAATKQPAAPAPSSAPATGGSGDSAPASPTVRRLARELGLDIKQVSGSGPGGRISEDDVKQHAKQIVQGAATGGGGVAAMPLPDFSQWGEVERERLSNIRRATADHMARSWASVAHVTQFDKADITDLEAMRKRYGKSVEAAGGKLTVTAIALKVVAGALKKFPHFNASLDVAANELVLKKYVHIGVAVDTDRGLLVPVIRDVDRKNILELAVELGQIAARARDRKTGLDEMQGGSFTITNLGGIGGTQFTPIVNVPEVAILGISRGSMEPVWKDGAFVPRLMLPLSLSYDHRVIDGADGARFLRWIAEALEQPFLLTLEG